MGWEQITGCEDFVSRKEISNTDMARMKCKCGYNLSNSEAPNDIQLRVYTDREWDKILDCEIIESWRIPIPNYDVWLCPNCKRIYVFKDGNKPIVVYNIEE